MRILVFSTDDFLPPAGGAETAFWEVARRNPQHQFTLVCARLERTRSRRQIVDGIHIRRIGIGHRVIDAFLLQCCGAFVGLAMHGSQRFDLVWAVMASYGAGAATLFTWMTGVPFLLTLQEGNNIERGPRAFPVLRSIYRIGFRSVDGLHAISHYLLSWGMKMGFHRDRPHAMIPNGVDIGLFSVPVSAAAIAAERAAQGFPAGSFVIATVSRLVPKNGIGDLIHAIARLPSRFVLAIYGYGVLERSLTDQARRLGVLDRVRFMGHLARERLPVVLRAADAFSRPSLTEGLGTAFLEAMAAGVPVIATPVGGIVDFVRDEENGFFAKPGDPVDLARVIEQVAGLDADRRAAINTAGVATVAEGYDWDDIAHRMDALFHRLCPRP